MTASTSDTIEDIKFLSQSPHRATVLEALAQGPQTRHDLRERAVVSRITVRRLVDDLEERGWIRHDEGQYEATATGRVVAAEFARFRANLETVGTLDDALRWLPAEAFDFDLACLQDAEVLPADTWPDYASSVSHAVERVEQTETIRGTAIGFTPEVAEAITEMTGERGGTFEVVMGESAFGMVQDNPGLREPFRAILESGNGSLHQYTGAEPLHMVMQFDVTVMICGHVDGGPPPGTLETEAEPVQSWAESYYRSALAQSTTVTVEMLTGEQPDTA